MEKEIDGQIYILKSHVEKIVSERVSKVAARASSAEDKLNDLQTRLAEAEKKHATVDILTQQIEKYKTDLNAAEQRYNRYQAISKHGLTDQDMVDAIEWQYNRAMAKTAKKDQLPLADWLQNHVENPDSAPQLLRPHLAKLHSQPVPDATPAPDTAPQMASLAQPTAQPPRTNAGVRSAPESLSLIDRGIQDPEFYKANRADILRAMRSGGR